MRKLKDGGVRISKSCKDNDGNLPLVVMFFQSLLESKACPSKVKANMRLKRSSSSSYLKGREWVEDRILRHLLEAPLCSDSSTVLLILRLYGSVSFSGTFHFFLCV